MAHKNLIQATFLIVIIWLSSYPKRGLSCSQFLFPCLSTFHSSSFHRKIEKQTESALKTITVYFCSLLGVKCYLDIFWPLNIKILIDFSCKCYSHSGITTGPHYSAGWIRSSLLSPVTQLSHCLTGMEKPIQTTAVIVLRSPFEYDKPDKIFSLNT